jgi:hypothetical protein
MSDSQTARSRNDSLDRGQVQSIVPYTAFQYVDVTFSTANTDYPIAHTLQPANPEDIDYEVVRKDRAGDLYHDQTGTRKAWGTGYIILRCSVASAVMTLRLSLRRT